MNKYIIIYGLSTETYYERYDNYAEAKKIYDMYKEDHLFCYLTLVLEDGK
jgi:hypothetical protein